MTKQRRRGDATPIARAVLTDAIARCARAWLDRWDRAPTTHELVHAFTICLTANPDGYVEDVGPVLAMEPLERPAAPPIDATAFEVAFRGKGAVGLDEAELYLRSKGLAKPGYGEVQTYLEIVGDTLLVDVQFEAHRAVPRFDQACNLVRAHVLPRYLANHAVARVVLRPMSGLADPVTLRWPPPDA